MLNHLGFDFHIDKLSQCVKSHAIKIIELLIPGSHVEISGTHGQRINTPEA
jgi:hypothetical protein